MLDQLIGFATAVGQPLRHKQREIHNRQLVALGWWLALSWRSHASADRDLERLAELIRNGDENDIEEIARLLGMGNDARTT